MKRKEYEVISKNISISWHITAILLLSSGIFLTVDSRKKDKVLTKEKVLKSIKKTSKKVFPSNKNLLDEENTKTGKWYTMLAKVRGYVDNNAGGDEDLLDAFSLCWTASRELINVLKKTHNSLFAEGRSMSYDNVEAAYQNIHKLQFEHENPLLQIEKRLKNIYYSGKKKDVREVLTSLSTHIRRTIAHMQDEFSKNSEVKKVISASQIEKEKVVLPEMPMEEEEEWVSEPYFIPQS